MNIQLIYPEHLQDWVGDGTKRPEKRDEFNYIGISIEERHGHYYYATPRKTLPRLQFAGAGGFLLVSIAAREAPWH